MSLSPFYVRRPTVLVLGPGLRAVSGVSTHLSLLFGSSLVRDYDLVHFQVGSEGRAGEEGRLALLVRLAKSPFQLVAAILRCGAGVVHVNTSVNPKAFWRDMVYVFAAKLAGAKVLFQLHGGFLDDFIGKSRAKRALVAATLRRADVIVVLGQYHVPACRELAPGRPVAVLPNGIDCAPYRELARPKREPGAPLRLVFMARLAPVKGVPELLEGLKLARQRGAEACLVIAGSGPEGGRLRQKVKAMQLEGQVSFAGAVYGEAKLRMLAEADVLALTSHSEGLPYAVLEAMAAGTVPLVTAVGAVPDVVKDGVQGLFVPLRDPQAIAQAIVRLAGDRAELERMSEACRKRVSAAFSIEPLAAGFRELYGRLCQRAGFTPASKSALPK